MKKFIESYLIPIVLVVAGAAAALLFTPISTELVKQGWCEVDDSICTTLLSAVILIVFAFIPVALAWAAFRLPVFNRGLEIFYRNDDPMCRHFNNPGPTGKPSCFIRLIIINRRNAPAENCVGRLEAIANDKGVPCSDWTNSYLCWERQPVPAPIRLNPKGDYKPLDVGWTVENEDTFRIRTDQSSQGIMVNRPRGLYYFRVVVTADGYDPVEQWFEVKWFREYDDFKMKKVNRPPHPHG